MLPKKMAGDRVGTEGQTMVHGSDATRTDLALFN